MARVLMVIALAATSSTAMAQTPTKGTTPQSVPVTLSEWKVELGRDTVRAGAVTFRITNSGGINHAFHVRGEGVDKGTREIAARQSGTLTVQLKAGKYEVFCPMADMSHKAAGMTRTLVVIAGDPTIPIQKPGS